MKGKVIAKDGDQYTILLNNGSLTVGNDYTLEDATRGTAAQNRAFHALLSAFYEWMSRIDTFQFEDNGRIFDFRTPSAHDFREYFKYKFGAGAAHYQYVEDDYSMVKVDSYEDIPTHVLSWPHEGKNPRIKAVLKSWADYTKKERRYAIDNLFGIIHAVSCHDRRVIEIMTGMTENNI